MHKKPIFCSQRWNSAYRSSALFWEQDMNYGKKWPTMCIAFPLPLTWLGRARGRQLGSVCHDWPWAALGASAGSGPGHCDACRVATWLPLAPPSSLGDTECIRSRSVIEFHTCHSWLWLRGLVYLVSKACWKEVVVLVCCWNHWRTELASQSL